MYKYMKFKHLVKGSGSIFFHHIQEQDCLVFMYSMDLCAFMFNYDFGQLATLHHVASWHVRESTQ